MHIRIVALFVNGFRLDYNNTLEVSCTHWFEYTLCQYVKNNYAYSVTIHKCRFTLCGKRSKIVGISFYPFGFTNFFACEGCTIENIYWFTKHHNVCLHDKKRRKYIRRHAPFLVVFGILYP